MSLFEDEASALKSKLCYEFVEEDTEFSVSNISNNNEMGFFSLEGVGDDSVIMSSINLIAYYERVYEINTFTSTMGDYDDDNSKLIESDSKHQEGGTVSVYAYQTDIPTNQNDGTYFTGIYDSIAITCIPNDGYIMAGIYINGEYLGTNNLGFDTYNFSCSDTPLYINLKPLFGVDSIGIIGLIILS